MQQIKIGSRDSQLAIVQAKEVMAVLGRGVLVTMKTKGDRILDRTLDQVGGKGLFVKELDTALMTHQIDFAVHSLKDVPLDVPDTIPILAYTKREDPRDVLVLPTSGVWDMSKPIGCTSARRRVQLQKLFPECTVEPIRGNVLTRLQKLDDGVYGALVLAAAGLHRLGLSNRITRYFSTEEMIPAAGQGIIAVQGRAGEWEAETKLLDNSDAHTCALAERAFVRTLNGGCFSPITAYAEVQETMIHLRGLYVSPMGVTVSGDLYGSRNDPIELGKSLAYLLKQQAEGTVEL